MEWNEVGRRSRRRRRKWTKKEVVDKRVVKGMQRNERDHRGGTSNPNPIPGGIFSPMTGANCARPSIASLTYQAYDFCERGQRNIPYFKCITKRMSLSYGHAKGLLGLGSCLF